MPLLRLKKFQRNWILGETIINICPFFSKIFLECMVKDFKGIIGQNYKSILAVYRGYNLSFYVDEGDASKIGELLVDWFISKPSFMTKTNSKIKVVSDRLRHFATLLPQSNLSYLTNRQLYNFCLEHEKLHKAYYQWGLIPVVSDMFLSNFTERIKNILRDFGISEGRLNKILVQLTYSKNKSLLRQEHDEMLKLGIAVQRNKNQIKIFNDLDSLYKEVDFKNFGLYTHTVNYSRRTAQKIQKLIIKINPAILSRLKRHYFKYFYTKFIFTEEQGVYDFDYYVKTLVRLVNGNSALNKVFRNERLKDARLLNKRNLVSKELRLSKKMNRVFIEWGNFMVTKVYRRFAQIFALYRMTPILEEIAKRTDLTLKQLKFLTISELKDVFLNNKLFDEKELDERLKFSVYFTDNVTHQFYTREKARKIYNLIKAKSPIESFELIGQCGCPGLVQGIVRLVNTPLEMKKVRDGDILVSICTQPDLLPAMKKAGAFVTEQGGVTSHAAIIAREFNIPCVIGTKIATKVLKDGMRVEVDANKGIVRILSQYGRDFSETR